MRPRAAPALLAAAAAPAAASPDGLCTAQAGKNCQGNDIRDAGLVTSAQECCDLCGSTQGCAAWTWNKNEGNHHCWVKRSCDLQTDQNAVSGSGAPPPAPPPTPKPPAPGPAPPTPSGDLCTVHSGVNCNQDDVRDGGVVSDAAACCALCTAEPACAAWTWNRGIDQHCWLKKDCGGRRDESRCDSGYGTRQPTPPPTPHPPTPPPVPGPPVRKDYQVGVSLGGHFLMESWMFDQGQQSHAAENDWVRFLRQTSDDFAIQTMRNHWAGYTPTEALDAAAEVGITHMRVPVGYWVVEPPVGGSSMREFGFNHEGFVTGGINYVEDLLAALQQRGMRALIDLHAMPGGASSCQSYAGVSVNQPYFWTGQVPGSNNTALAACGGAGPYRSTRPGGQSWMDVGVDAAVALADWIVSLEGNASLKGVVAGLEVVNEPGLGFGGMSQHIKDYHDRAVPKVQAAFRKGGVGVNVTVNFIGPNEGGMGSFLKQRVEAGTYDGASLVVDYHNYLNWAGSKDWANLRGTVCGTNEHACAWSQYLDAGLSVLIGEWSDASNLNARQYNNLEDAACRENLASLLADQTSMFQNVPGTVGDYYWALRMGSGWDPRPSAQARQAPGTAWDKSLTSYGTRVWNWGELKRLGVLKPVRKLDITGVCKCNGCRT